MKARRFTVHLSLSGGGFRATLIHLGVLRRLNELGLDQDVRVVSGVSGGAVAAATWVQELAKVDGRVPEPVYGASDEALRNCTELLLGGITRGIRNHWLRVPVLGSLALALAACVATTHQWPGTPWSICAVLFFLVWGICSDQWLRFWPIWRRFRRDLHLTWGIGRLVGPRVPGLILTATSLREASQYRFTQAGAQMKAPHSWIPLPRARPRRRGTHSLDQVVAASAAVPGLLPPVTVRDAAGSKVKGLVDGGVYDNQGISVFVPCEGAKHPRRVDVFVVSDASLQVQKARLGWFSRLLSLAVGAIPFASRVRALKNSWSVTDQQMRENMYEILEREVSKKETKTELSRSLLPHGLFRCYAVFDLTPKKELPPNEGGWRWKPIVKYVSRVRTDLDAFSSEECRALMYFGYRLVDQRLNDHCWEVLSASRELAAKLKKKSTWVDFNRQLDDMYGRVLEPMRATSAAGLLRHLRYSHRHAGIIRRLARSFPFQSVAGWLWG